MSPRQSLPLFLFVVLMFAACESNPSRVARGGGTGDAPMTSSGELAIANPKPMDGQATFFAGKIDAEVMLAKSDAVWKNPSAAESRDAGGGGAAGGRGGFSGGLGGGGRRGGGGGGGRRGGGDTPSQSASDPTPRGPVMRASNAPPIQLRLRLTNHGDQPVDVEVLDFNSELGNFVVQPTKITLPSHESVEADPMTSRLGVPAVEEIPITVRLRIGGKGSAAQTQTIRLRPRPTPPAAAP